MTSTRETISDSDAYAAGMAAYADDDFVPCPFEAGSRAEMMWYEGRSDMEHASRFTDITSINDGY